MKREDSASNLELLLAHAEDRRPVLEEGLPLDAAARAPRPEGAGNAPAYLWDPGADPNSLPVQRWGVVAPLGAAGDRMLALISPLRWVRQEEQGGAPVRIYRVPAWMDAAEAARWKDQVLRSEAVPEQERPRYLLLLGDLDQVSLELQQALASDAFVGRLSFPDEWGFEAYVEKVLRWERRPAPGRVRSLFFTARDGTPGTHMGLQGLVLPSLQSFRERQERGGFAHVEFLECGGPGEPATSTFLEQAAASHPSVLLSVSHGLGAPRGGWRSPQAQRALQGAMVLAPEQYLQAPDVARRPFLPGGIWLYVACFGAGTPQTSTCFHWLRRLQELGRYNKQVDAVLASLPAPGEQPFLAALPQAALSNPAGPLAVIGHVDLAWTYSFQDVERRGNKRPSRFLGLLRALLEGRRVGVALSALLRFASEASAELISLYDRGEAAQDAARPSEENPALRASLWMLRQDVTAYVLLGDPAVRLPQPARGARPAVSRPDLAAILGL